MPGAADRRSGDRSAFDTSHRARTTRCKPRKEEARKNTCRPSDDARRKQMGVLDRSAFDSSHRGITYDMCARREA
jgi:hypothetical protein